MWQRAVTANQSTAEALFALSAEHRKEIVSQHDQHLAQQRWLHQEIRAICNDAKQMKNTAESLMQHMAAADESRAGVLKQLRQAGQTAVELRKLAEERSHLEEQPGPELPHLGLTAQEVEQRLQHIQEQCHRWQSRLEKVNREHERALHTILEWNRALRAAETSCSTELPSIPADLPQEAQSCIGAVLPTIEQCSAQVRCLRRTMKRSERGVGVA